MHGALLLDGSPWANLYAVGAVKKKGKTASPGLFEKRKWLLELVGHSIS
jgi:hypothetical protein